MTDHEDDHMTEAMSAVLAEHVVAKGMGGGGGGDQTIKGPTPPSDTSKFWFNTTLGFTFYYESGVNRWLSDQNYVQNFSANGNLNNNGFFKIDNVRLNADRGVVTPYESKKKVKDSLPREISS